MVKTDIEKKKIDPNLPVVADPRIGQNDSILRRVTFAPCRDKGISLAALTMVVLGVETAFCLLQTELGLVFVGQREADGWPELGRLRTNGRHFVTSWSLYYIIEAF